MSGENFAGTGFSIDALEEMPYWRRCDVLAEAIADIREQRQNLKHLQDEGEAYLIELMGQQKPPATVADTASWHINIDVDRTYINVVEGGLDGLQAYVSADDYEKTVKPEMVYKVDGRMLNVLKKRGGPIAAVIERAHVLDKATPKIALSRKSG